jgi:glycosyltransferase involved in cell wall biosynthesis
MRLLVVFDHRFFRGDDGTIFSAKSYGHSFFAKRYLRAFDAVTILARVAEAPAGTITAEPTSGPGVTLASLGDWQGPLGLARAWRAVRAGIDRHLREAEAVLLIAPGMLATLAHGRLLRAARPYGVEVVSDPYDAMAPAAMRHPLRPGLRWSATRQLRAICVGAAAASYVTRETLQRRYPCPGYSVGVSDVELPDEAFIAAPRRVGETAPRRADEPPERRSVVISVGTMSQVYKGQDVLLDAVAELCRDGLDLELVLVGDGRHRGELAARAAGLGIGERVRFAGALPAGAAIRERLDAADCFVLPSRTEGLPRALVEAMARGLPAIASAVGGVPELLAAEDLVPPGDAGALAAALRAVLRDPARRARLSARNLAVAREYREELLAAERLGFYEALRRVTRAQQRKIA